MRRMITLLVVLAIPILITSSPVLAAEGRLAGGKCTVEYSGVDPAYAQAMATLYDAVYMGYRETFGITPPKDAVIKISTGADSTSLWTDGDRYIFLELAKESDLAPGSGYFHIYGLCHEVGHMVMYSKLKTLAELPKGLGEGWAHYTGSLVCDYVWASLGSAAWPLPHDYSARGSARLSTQCTKGAADAEALAACTFYTIGETYGHRKVGWAMRGALKGKPRGGELMGKFAEVLDAQNGSGASALIPAEVRTSVLAQPGEAIILDHGVAVQTTAHSLDAEGWMHFDDGLDDGMRSIAGSAHTMKFNSAGGKLDGVMLKGARYGLPQTDSIFILSILDGSFQLIEQFEYPFIDFHSWGVPLVWEEFDTGGLEVPGVFYVNFDFNPSATDGVYVGFDAHSSGHSYTGLPGSSLVRFRAGDWMIRARLEAQKGVPQPRTAPGGEEWLFYDDDTEDGMRSIAGSAHTVVFNCEGGKLTRVRLKGARYGTPQSSSVFRLTVLDGGYREIKTIEYAYMNFPERGEPLYWVEFAPFGVKVPEVFYLNFSFNPTATEGIYVGYDSNSRGHSYTGRVDGSLIEFPSGDWMVQALVE